MICKRREVFRCTWHFGEYACSRWFREWHHAQECLCMVTVRHGIGGFLSEDPDPPADVELVEISPVYGGRLS